MDWRVEGYTVRSIRVRFFHAPGFGDVEVLTPSGDQMWVESVAIDGWRVGEECALAFTPDLRVARLERPAAT